MIEIFRNNRWSYVCNDHWNIEAAKISCEELKFPGVSPTQPGDNGTNPIHDSATVVRCDGGESSLLDCQFDDTVPCESHAVQVTCLDGKVLKIYLFRF